MSQAATMIAAMNESDRGLFEDLLDTIEQVLEEAPAAASPRAVAQEYEALLRELRRGERR